MDMRAAVIGYLNGIFIQDIGQVYYVCLGECLVREIEFIDNVRMFTNKAILID